MARETNAQVGGTHYKKCAIEPVEYIHANGLDFNEGSIVKYISRHRNKNGAEDIKKIKDYCDIILELDYGIKRAVDDNVKDLEVRLKKEGLTQRQIENILGK
jgi:hypothetical protein